MTDFMLLFRASEEEHQERMGTPERAAESMQAWLEWVRQIEASGRLKDPGQPLDRTGKMIWGRKKVVVDGPYVEAKDLVLGFMIVQSRNLEEAVALAKGCPILDGFGSVEVRPTRTV